MNLLFRLIGVLLKALSAPRQDVMASSVLTFRVLPSDIDFNLHLTNARYFSFMDLGRVDLLVRSGVAGLLIRRRWQPVLGASTVRFRRPLAPFQPFRLVSRVLCWDERWLYLEHRLETLAGEMAASAVMQGAFLERGAILPPAQVLAALGDARPSPPKPERVSAWQPQTL